jgi:protein-S-isoprenylcysteine O-methyltransferase Ste14
LQRDRWVFIRRLVLGIAWNTATLGAALFGPAGTLHWWRAWVVLGAIAIGGVVTMVGVLRTRPGLLNERFKGLIQKGQPWIDRVIVLLFVFSYGGAIAFIPLDVFHFHLLPKPPIWVSSFGFLLIVIGWCIISLVFRENAFAAPVVRHQAERQHAVVDTGVYRIVRHPMYIGIMLLNVGLASWLESYAGAIATIVPAGLLAVRIVFEERFLRRELPGYNAYVEKVRYRLVPFVW